MNANNVKRFSALLKLLLLALIANAQEIRGRVSESVHGLGLSAATVSTSGNRGTSTSFQGEYVLKLGAGANKVMFSSIGYGSRTVTIYLNAGETRELNITLQALDSALEQVVVTGSRGKSRTKLESPVPVDILDVKALASYSPQVSIGSLLNYTAPSFTSNSFTLNDGTDHIDPASLRGMGVDQVLLLVNGKRYHKTSLLNQAGTSGRGQVGTDLNSIPLASIDHIEILRDGAAAQYGSDAIAGVINILLKKQTETVEASVFTGAYATGESHLAPGTGWDGKQLQMGVNYGIPITNDGGFINFGGYIDNRKPTNRMIAYEGTIFLDYNNPADYPNPTGEDITESELTKRGLTRSDFNMKVGQAETRNSGFTFNSVVPFNNHQFEFYSFGGLNYRQGRSAGYTRLPYNYRNIPEIYPNGFLPHINSRIFDLSLAAGIRGKLGDWHVDFSNIYGGNKFLYIIDNTLNASLLEKSPTRFDAGGHAFYQNTTNFDISRRLTGVANGLNLAFGLENRYENYRILPGEEASWRNYGLKKQYITSAGDTILIDDINGDTPTIFDPISGYARPGGSQVFPGFRKSVNQFRNSYAGYADAELEITNHFLAGVAIRAENYTDFGKTFNWKIVSRYKVGDNWSVRGSYNTGFRAPDLHQIYYQNTNTLLVNGQLTEVGTFPNDSRAAKLLGIPQLKAEQSNGFTAGLAGKLGRFRVSVDYYSIFVKNRIVVTNAISGDPAGSPIEQEIYTILQQANAGYASFYVNAIDARTQGLDFVLSYDQQLGQGKFHTELAGTFSSTKRVGDIHTPPGLEPLAGIFFSGASRVVLEEAAVREKVNWTLNYSIANWGFFLRNVYFGPVTELADDPREQQVYQPKLVTDISVSYDLTKKLQLVVGSNNLFDSYPDKTKDPNYVDNGRFLYSPYVSQFGANGRFLFAKVNFRL